MATEEENRILEAIGNLRTDMETKVLEAIGSLRTDMESQISCLRTDLESQISALRTDVESQVGEIKTEMQAHAAQLDAEVKRWDDRFFQLSKDTLTFTRNVITAGVIVAILVPAIKDFTPAILQLLERVGQH